MYVRFMEYLIEDGKSEGTVNAYLLSLKGFLTWVSKTKKNPTTYFNPDTIIQYITYLTTVKKSSPKTISAKLTAIDKFIEFMQKTEQLTQTNHSKDTGCVGE